MTSIAQEIKTKYQGNVVTILYQGGPVAGLTGTVADGPDDMVMIIIAGVANYIAGDKISSFNL